MDPAAADTDLETPSGKGAADENFPVGSWLLPKHLRPHVFTFYAYARAIDDIADNPAMGSNDKITRLDAFADALQNGSSVPALAKAEALRLSLIETEITTKHGLDLISAFKQDAVQRRYDSWADLLDYCDRSAAPVGRFLLDLHGEDKALYPFSDALCNALQVINHLQDCGKDYRDMDRVYLPMAWIRIDNAGVEHLSRDALSSQMRRVLDRALERVDTLLAEARRLPTNLRSRRLGAESAVIQAIAERLTARLKREDPLATRVALSKPAAALTAFRALLGFWIDMLILSGLAFLAWLYLVLAHHGFWRADQRLPIAPPSPAVWPSITAIVPARNEAPTIGACVAALLAQTYGGPLRVIVVDDASTDGTGEVAQRAGDDRLTVIHAPPLPPGWTSKLNALQAGVAETGDTLLWFTDADVVHGPDVLRRLVAQMVTHERDLVSLMVRLNCESFWEKLLVPAFVYFFQMLYPFRAVNDDASAVAGAAGGIAAIRGAVIDDCALAQAVKRSGGRLWLGLADESRSLRAAPSLAPLWRMVARTAFTQLRHSWTLLAGTVAGLALLFLIPLFAVSTLGHGGTTVMLLGLSAWALMAISMGPTLRVYGLPIVTGFALPAAALLYLAMTVASAVAHLQGRGGSLEGSAL